MATVWGLFNQNIAINQLIGNSEVLCWAAKWDGEEHCYYSSIEMTSKKKMLKEIFKLLEEADAVTTYNGDGFDLKILNKEFALQGWSAPSPYKSIDLLKTIRKRFRFTSNKLDYVVQQFGLGKKTKHPGHELWLSCMNKAATDYKDSWKLMEEYNCNDVFLLEQLYHRVLGWIPNHPSHAVYTERPVCPNCGGHHMQSRGTYTTNALLYRRWQCQNQDCGKWTRSRVAIKTDRSQQLVSIN